MVRVDLIKPGEARPGPAADVWGLGCLLYELLTGELLFFDPDWTSFYARLTLDAMVRRPQPRTVAVQRVAAMSRVMSMCPAQPPAELASPWTPRCAVPCIRVWVKPRVGQDKFLTQAAGCPRLWWLRLLGCLQS